MLISFSTTICFSTFILHLGQNHIMNMVLMHGMNKCPAKELNCIYCMKKEKWPAGM